MGSNNILVNGLNYISSHPNYSLDYIELIVWKLNYKSPFLHILQKTRISLKYCIPCVYGKYYLSLNFTNNEL